MKRLAICLLFTGCAIRPATIGHRVEGIGQARQMATAQQASIATATASSAVTSSEISRIDGKASVILQWLNRQDRKVHEKP